MVAASFAQVINRNLIGAGISWFEELARYCMIYLTLLAAEMGLRDGTQISVTAVTDLLKGRFKKIVHCLAKLVVVVFAGVVFITSLDLIQAQLKSGQISPGLKLPMVIPYFSLTLSFGVIFVVQTVTLILLSIDLFRKEAESDRKGGVNE